MRKWEYLTQAVPVAPLTSLGQDGWRLVAVCDNIMFFERPVAEPEPEPAAESMPVAAEPEAIVEPGPEPTVEPSAPMPGTAEPVASAA